MYILTLNSGSSSLKIQLIDPKKWKVLYKGHADGIGLPFCEYKSSHGCCDTPGIKKHEQALKFCIGKMLDSKVIKDLSEIKAVGHRVVHGGEKYKTAIRITPKIFNELKRLSYLAPLHNPANLEGIKAAQKLLKKSVNIAIFDTAFHHTMEEKAYLYGIPRTFYKKYGVRRYGFHGTSHKYVANEAIKYLGAKKARHLITCHLGNGASITAIKDGQVIDTSMGFTPLEGVIMGTRSGDLDPAIILFFIEKCGIKPRAVDRILNYESGLKGLYGKSDMRELRDAWFNKNDKKAKLAMDIYCYKIAKYLGSYLVALGQLDALVFTGGIGENAWYIREWICNYLKIELNHKKNKRAESPLSKIAKINSGKPIVLVIPTNEELQIAKETYSLIS